MQNNRPYIIGISGGSASGKTFLLKQLLDSFSESQISLISQDNYYYPLEEQKTNNHHEVNFDHPDSVNLDLLADHLRRISGGETITIKEYTFNNPNVVPADITQRPAPLIILEGLFVFYHKKIASLLDLKIFVDADEHVKLSRRIRRDYSERGYSLEEVLIQYERDVIPMYRQFVMPYKDEADLIIPNNRHMYRATGVLVNHLRHVLGERQAEAGRS